MKRTFFLFVILSFLAACAPPEPAYSFDLGPSDFVQVVDNPYFPLLPGSKYIYEEQTGEGQEHTEVEVLTEARLVMGITSTVVHDTVTLDGVLIEDTYDWYAQDKEGNVWYLGEDVSNFENGTFQDKSGSWEAGVDGALPGIIMYANPAAHLGETYRQEYYAGIAEDMADLLSATESVTVPFGAFELVVQTKDYTPLEPDAAEQKFYSFGIGMIKTINLNTGEEAVLVEYIPPAK